MSGLQFTFQYFHCGLYCPRVACSLRTAANICTTCWTFCRSTHWWRLTSPHRPRGSRPCREQRSASLLTSKVRSQKFYQFQQQNRRRCGRQVRVQSNTACSHISSIQTMRARAGRREGGAAGASLRGAGPACRQSQGASGGFTPPLAVPVGRGRGGSLDQRAGADPRQRRLRPRPHLRPPPAQQARGLQR